jgi:hypothetical protein
VSDAPTPPAKAARDRRLPGHRAYVPPPTVILLGCAQLTPDHRFGAAKEPPPFHAPGPPEAIGEADEVTVHGVRIFRRRDRGGTWSPDRCPTCRGSVTASSGPVADATYCVRCDSMSAANETRLRLQRFADETGRAERKRSKHIPCRRAASPSGPILSERDRRRLYNGYRGAIDRPGELPASGPARRRCEAARAWLAQIGQLPDWSLVLDRHGRVVATLSTAPAPEVAAG